MARPLRIEYAGAVYHLMARRNHGQVICADDADRKMWLTTLREAWRRTGWRIHAWVLMGNHYHFKGQTEKQVLAWSLYGRTTVTRRWLAERLQMGYETRVSQAVRWVESSRAQEVLEMRKRLEGCAL